MALLNEDPVNIYLFGNWTLSNASILNQLKNDLNELLNGHQLKSVERRFRIHDANRASKLPIPDTRHIIIRCVIPVIPSGTSAQKIVGESITNALNIKTENDLNSDLVLVIMHDKRLKTPGNPTSATRDLYRTSYTKSSMYIERIFGVAYTSPDGREKTIVKRTLTPLSTRIKELASLPREEDINVRTESVSIQHVTPVKYRPTSEYVGTPHPSRTSSSSAFASSSVSSRVPSPLSSRSSSSSSSSASLPTPLLPSSDQPTAVAEPAPYVVSESPELWIEPVVESGAALPKPKSRSRSEPSNRSRINWRLWGPLAAAGALGGLALYGSHKYFTTQPTPQPTIRIEPTSPAPMPGFRVMSRITPQPNIRIIEPTSLAPTPGFRVMSRITPQPTIRIEPITPAPVPGFRASQPAPGMWPSRSAPKFDPMSLVTKRNLAGLGLAITAPVAAALGLKWFRNRHEGERVHKHRNNKSRTIRRNTKPSPHHYKQHRKSKLKSNRRSNTTPRRKRTV